MTNPPTEEPSAGFPLNPPEPVDLPVPEGVREITQDPSWDPETDPEEDQP